MPADTIDFSRRRVWPLEHHEQQAFLRYCDDLGYPWTEYVSIPNEGKRGPRAQAILKANGVKKGFPDLLFLASCNDIKGFGVEMKRARWAYGKSQSTWDAAIKPDQLLWRDRLIALGYAHCFAYGALEAALYMHAYRQGFHPDIVARCIERTGYTQDGLRLLALESRLDADKIYEALPKRATARRRKLPTRAGRKPAAKRRTR